MTTTKTTATLAERNHTPQVEHILAVYRQATPAQIADGVTWYSEAHSLALALDPADPLRAAGVIAAFSPRCPWERNKTLAIQAYADGVASGSTQQMCAKVNRLLAGEDVVTVLHAPKTVAFAKTNANTADEHQDLVDRHAMSIPIDRVTTDEDTKSLGLKGAYEIYADAYREAARIAGVSPAVMQAVTWVVWRETRTKFASANRAAAGR